MDSPAPVKKSLIDPPAFAAELSAAAAAAGFRVEVYGEEAGCPLLGLTRRTRGPRPRIYLSSGMHGDEPAPPHAVLELLRAREFTPDADWIICPLLNPGGLARGTRENARGVDLNRDYRGRLEPETRAHVRWLRRQPAFDLALCLHEDWESTGFYLYELNPRHLPTLADRMVAAAGGFLPIEGPGMIDGREALVPGIIRPTEELAEREHWPEAIYLQVHHAALGYTLKTPSALPLRQRVAAQRAALHAAIGGLGALSARA